MIYGRSGFPQQNDAEAPIASFPAKAHPFDDAAARSAGSFPAIL